VESKSDEFDREYDLLKEQLDRAEELKKSYQGVNSNLSTINVNMNGSHGVWICATACLVMLVAFISGGIAVSRELNRQDADRREDRAEIKRLNEYLLATWAKAPYLKPENYDARPNYKYRPEPSPAKPE
jgi:hypothetical protein